MISADLIILNRDFAMVCGLSLWGLLTTLLQNNMLYK